MSEEYNDKNTDHETEFREIIQEQLDGMLPAVMEFDEYRQSLYDGLADMVTKLHDENCAPGSVDLTVTLREQPLQDLFSEILRDTKDRDGAIDVIVGIFKSDSDERVNLLRKLLNDDECIQFFDKEQLRSLVENAFDPATESTAVSNLVGLYQSDLSSDLDNFMQHLISLHEDKLLIQAPKPEMQEMTLEINKTPRDHAVDIAKIAAGVTIALVVDKLLRREK